MRTRAPSSPGPSAQVSTASSAMSVSSRVGSATAVPAASTANAVIDRPSKVIGLLHDEQAFMARCRRAPTVAENRWGTFRKARCYTLVRSVPVDSHSYYTTYAPMVLRRCRRLLRDDQAARDAMHDVFVQVLSRESALSDHAPSALLFRIATNVCLNRIRSRK